MCPKLARCPGKLALPFSTSAVTPHLPLPVLCCSAANPHASHPGACTASCNTPAPVPAPTGILAYNEYGSVAAVKALSWLLGVVLSVLIVASRKHYTVDVVIAWYTVPLVFYAMYRRWTTRRPMSDFIQGSAVSAFDDVDGGELELEEVGAGGRAGPSAELDRGTPSLPWGRHEYQSTYDCRRGYADMRLCYAVHRTFGR